MPALTPTFLFDLESRMRLIASKRYAALTAPGNLWYDKIAKRSTIGSKKERLIWLLETLKIERPNASHGGGQQSFADIISQTQEIEVQNAAPEGLRLKKEQLEDLDGNGVQLAAHWAGQATALGAYWPQKTVAAALIANPTAYDGLSFFNTGHYLNATDSTDGTYANDFTSSASGIYPGAVPIGGALDTAVDNVQKVIAYLASIKQPNGEDPRFLKAATMFVPPALAARAQQITNAKFIAQVASSGTGTGDIESVVRNWGLGQPVVVPELGSAFGGSDTTWYMGAEDMLNDELGAMLYVEREPFSILYHGPMTDAQLAAKREYQWTCEGRNIVAPGHPFLLFRCKAT